MSKRSQMKSLQDYHLTWFRGPFESFTAILVMLFVGKTNVRNSKAQPHARKIWLRIWLRIWFLLMVTLSSSGSIQELFVLLWRKGPDTEGVFRTACNSKNLSAVRDQLNSGVAVDLEALPVTLLVGLLKVNTPSLLQHAVIHTSVYTTICIVPIIPSISQYLLGAKYRVSRIFCDCSCV